MNNGNKFLKAKQSQCIVYRPTYLLCILPK